MNPLLSNTRQQILAKVNPKLVPVVNKLVNAGHQVMFSPKSTHLLQQQLAQQSDDAEVIGSGVAKLIGMLYIGSKKTAPVQGLVPAGMVLLCDGLDFLEEAGAVQVTPDFLAQCTKAAGSAIAQMFGATPQRLAQLAQQAKQGGPGRPAQGAQPAQAAPAVPPAPGIVGAAMQGGA